jgi:hypothetical protein
VDPVAEGGQAPVGGNTEQEDCDGLASPDFSFRTTIVSPSPDQLLTQNDILSKVIVDATREVLLANNVEVDSDGSSSSSKDKQKTDGQAHPNLSLESILHDFLSIRRQREFRYQEKNTQYLNLMGKMSFLLVHFHMYSCWEMHTIARWGPCRLNTEITC